jgi:hypothetical protein
MRVRDVVEVIGAAAIVGSLIFVGLQLQQDRQHALTSNMIAFMESESMFEQSLSEHAVTWTKGNSDQPLAEEEKVIFESLVRFNANNKFFRFISVRLLGEDGALAVLHFADWLHANPGARQFWEKWEKDMVRLRSRYHVGENGLGDQWVSGVFESLEKMDHQLGED